MVRWIVLTLALVVLIVFNVSPVHANSIEEDTEIKSIQQGDVLPSAIVDLVVSDGTSYSFQEGQDIASLLSSHKKCVLFAVPGAFTPTCSSKHLPGFVSQADALAAQGIEAIYCLSVNDRYVMRAWGQATEGAVGVSILKLVADGNADFARALGLTMDRSANRMSTRSKRFAMIIEEGKVKELHVDEAGLKNTSAEIVLQFLLNMVDSSNSGSCPSV
jgi:glutaredoxin/glutathione-dependent peroxiredoxin